MTSNQIAYVQHLETARSNLAKEEETHRSNLVKEEETRRHNIVTEHETSRHNVEQEQLGWSQLYESHRSNVAKESLSMESNAINAMIANIRQQEADLKRIDTAVGAAKGAASIKLTNAQTNTERAKAQELSSSSKLKDAQKIKTYSDLGTSWGNMFSQFIDAVIPF